MNTLPTNPMDSDNYTKALDDTDGQFFLFNPTSEVIYMKFTEADSAPTGKDGAILILPYKGIERGNITGYPWILGPSGAVASITAE